MYISRSKRPWYLSNLRKTGNIHVFSAKDTLWRSKQNHKDRKKVVQKRSCVIFFTLHNMQIWLTLTPISKFVQQKKICTPRNTHPPTQIALWVTLESHTQKTGAFLNDSSIFKCLLSYSCLKQIWIFLLI